MSMKSKASSKASAPKSGPKSATYYDMIKSAISDLADRTGSLLQAISKSIASSKPKKITTKKKRSVCRNEKMTAEDNDDC